MTAIDDAILLNETIRVNVRKKLETKYQGESVILSALLPNIHHHILDSITAIFREYIGRICNGATHQSEEFFKTLDGQSFRFLVAPNIRCPEELTVRFYPVTLYSTTTQESKFNCIRKQLTTNYGGYTYIVIYHTPEVQVDTDLIQTIVEGVISTTYEWTYSRLFAITHEMNERVTERLYGRLREIYPELPILDRLWLGFVHNGQCQYLIENRRRESLLLTMSQAGRKLGLEPLPLASLIIVMNLPFEKSAAHEAFLLNKPLRVNISKLPYSASKPTLVIAEQIIFDTDEIIVIPISHIERTQTFLVAFSPSTDSEFWIRALERNKKDVDFIFHEEILSLSKFAKSLKRYIQLPNQEKARFLGDIIGHALATFFQRIKWD